MKNYYLKRFFLTFLRYKLEINKKALRNEQGIKELFLIVIDILFMPNLFLEVVSHY